jgi:7,8-dihydroneopterin aldolase/epimerase/oxygenase
VSLDRLTLSGLELWCRVGCTAEERAFPQRVELDADLFLSLSRAGREDDLAASVDYAAVAARLKKVLETGEWRLAEALAERAAREILEGFPVPSVQVRVRKRALPGLAFAEVAVSRGAGGGGEM